MRLHHRYVRVSVLSSDTSPTHPIALKLRPSRARGGRGRFGGRYRRRGRGRFSGGSRWRYRGGASAHETDRYRDRGGEGDIFQKFHSRIVSIGYFVRQQGAPNLKRYSGHFCSLDDPLWEPIQQPPSLQQLLLRSPGERVKWPSFGREGNGESLGQLGGASLSNCRELRVEGGATRSLTTTSQKVLLPVKTELSRREPIRTNRRARASQTFDL